MGAEFQTAKISADSESALQSRFRSLVEDAKHEHGHGGYTGSFAEAHTLVVLSKTFTSYNEAEDFLDQNCQKWEACKAVKVIEPSRELISNNLQESKRYQALKAKLHELNKIAQDLGQQAYNFKNEAQKATPKTGKVTCRECKSVLNRAFLNSFQCPVCNKVALMPVGVKNKYNAIVKKLDSAKAKATEIQAKMKAIADEQATKAAAKGKVNSYYLIGGCFSC